MLKPYVPKFRSDLPPCLKDITEKQVPEKLKSIVGGCGAGADIACHSGPELERGHLLLERGANLRSTK